jgi:hypothetical protein
MVYFPGLPGFNANPCISVRAITRAALLQGFDLEGKMNRVLAYPKGFR